MNGYRSVIKFTQVSFSLHLDFATFVPGRVLYFGWQKGKRCSYQEMRWRRIALPGVPVNLTGVIGESTGKQITMLKFRSRSIPAALIAAVLLSGCAQSIVTEPTVTQSTETVNTTLSTETTEITTSETEPKNQPFEFNPHAYSCFLEACYDSGYKESFFNLVDALCEGKDTFKCSSKEVYEFCMDSVTLNQLYPVACMQITSKSKDGGPSYEDGIGHIYYNKPVDEYLQRQNEFRKDITGVMNEYIKPGYTDFEKCLALYDYISSNYSYDYDDELRKTSDGSGYCCFKLKKGVCADYSAWYAYLLMECGVNAIAVQNFGNENSIGYHAWTYVQVNGFNYHIDVTWALQSEGNKDGAPLDYFMMTDQNRDFSGYPADKLEIPLLNLRYAAEITQYSFVANDKTYRMPDFATLIRYDTEKNIIYYRDPYFPDEAQEFIYE